MHEPQCLNCGYDLQDAVNFCGACGQNVHTHKMTMHQVWHDLFHAFTHTDKGIIHLIRELLVRPGIVAREYVDGKRKKYFNPFSFLVIVVAVATLLISSFNLMTQSSPSNPIGTFLNKHANIVIFLNVPFCALFSWLFFKRSGRTYAENLVLSAYTSGERSVFYSIVIVPLMLIFKAQYFVFVSIYLGLWMVYFAWACMQFYGKQSFAGFVKGFLAALCEQLVIYLFIFTAYFIYHRFFQHR